MVLEMDMWREGYGEYWDAIEEQQAIREQEEAKTPPSRKQAPSATPGRCGSSANGPASTPRTRRRRSTTAASRPGRTCGARTECRARNTRYDTTRFHPNERVHLMAKLRSNLPEGDRNGLSSITGQLCDAPHVKHIILAIVDCKSVSSDMDTGEVTPTARILRIEPVTRADYGTAEKLMRRALETRHGSTVLPFDTENELTELFAEIGDNPDDAA